MQSLAGWRHKQCYVSSTKWHYQDDYAKFADLEQGHPAENIVASLQVYQTPRVGELLVQNLLVFS